MTPLPLQQVAVVLEALHGRARVALRRGSIAQVVRARARARARARVRVRVRGIRCAEAAA